MSTPFRTLHIQHNYKLYNIAGLLSKLPSRGKLQVSLETLQCEVYTVSPIRVSVMALLHDTFCEKSSVFSLPNRML